MLAPETDKEYDGAGTGPFSSNVDDGGSTNSAHDNFMVGHDAKRIIEGDEWSDEDNGNEFPVVLVPMSAGTTVVEEAVWQELGRRGRQGI